MGTFDSGLTRQFLSYAQANQTVKRAFDAAGYSGFTAHSIRHMWSKVAFRSSPGTARAISENVGHSSLQITHQNYGKSTLQERKQQLAKGLKQDVNEEIALALEAMSKNTREGKI